jgi:transcriptional regulator with XRE-family HTH domain
MDREKTHADDGRTRFAVNVDRIISGRGEKNALAEKFGVNRTTLYKYSHGNQLPDMIEFLWRISDHAGCTIDDLVGRTDSFNVGVGTIPVAGIGEILAAVAEVLAEVRKMAARAEKRPVPAPEEQAVDHGVETGRVTVGGGFTTILCDACDRKVTLPDSAPAHDLAAAIERFRRNHGACLNGKEIET